MNGVIEENLKEKTPQFDPSAAEFVIEVAKGMPKIPPNSVELNITAAEFVPVSKISLDSISVSKIQLNIEAKAFDPTGFSHLEETKTSTILSSNPVEVPKETKISQDDPIFSQGKSEETTKIDTKCNKISVDSVKIQANHGDSNEIDHNSPLPHLELSESRCYSIDNIIDLYKDFFKYEEFSRLDKKIEDFSHRKIQIYKLQARNSSPKKKNTKREVLRLDEFKTADSDSWRKKKSLEEEKIAEAARKNTRKLSSTIEETEKMKRKIKVTLNKMSPNNFEKLKLELLAIGKESRLALHTLVEYIFEKAWSEVKYTPMYAQLCKFCKLEFENFSYGESSENLDESPSKKANLFRYDLLVMVENAFHNTSEVVFVGKDPETVAALIKKKTQGNVRFIGELLKVRIIAPKIIQQCVENLLCLTTSNPLDVNEDKLEGACLMISTAGACFEKRKLLEETNKIFTYLQEILACNQTISAKVKFLIMNLMDERASNWKKDLTDQPKTVEEIRNEFQQEKEEVINRNRY